VLPLLLRLVLLERLADCDELLASERLVLVDRLIELEVDVLFDFEVEIEVESELLRERLLTLLSL